MKKEIRFGNISFGEWPPKLVLIALYESIRFGTLALSHLTSVNRACVPGSLFNQNWTLGPGVNKYMDVCICRNVDHLIFRVVVNISSKASFI